MSDTIWSTIGRVRPRASPEITARPCFRIQGGSAIQSAYQRGRKRSRCVLYYLCTKPVSAAFTWLTLKCQGTLFQPLSTAFDPSRGRVKLSNPMVRVGRLPGLCRACRVEG